MIANLAATAHLLLVGAVILATGFALTLQIIKLDEALQIVRAV